MKRNSIEFIEKNKPVNEFTTKFGGQPVWLNDPQWTLSKETGNPMRFICQISLDKDIFGPITSQMAYIFITDEDEYVDGTWEPDGGENAIILQPGNTTFPIKTLNEGPTLYKMVKKMLKSRLVPQPCEYILKTTSGEDPDFVSEEKRSEWTDEEWEKYADALDGNKIGGTPIFIQGDEFPDSGSWKLLLALDSTSVPFYINFGDSGIGYAFISENGEIAKFLWQCA